VLVELKAAGLDSMPGGGAEIFAKGTRDRLIRGKADAAQWLEVMRTAHRLGIPTNATMLYGHVESIEDGWTTSCGCASCRTRRAASSPSSRSPSSPGRRRPWSSGDDGLRDLKAIAVARLLLDNFPHVKSYWIMITPRLAQVGLSFGADDIDGTVTEEKIAHDAGPRRRRP